MGAPRLRTYREIAECLARIGGEELVLVGGQAVGFWVDRYFDLIPELAVGAPYASKDIDVRGDRRTVEACARAKSTMRSFCPRRRMTQKSRSSLTWSTCAQVRACSGGASLASASKRARSRGPNRSDGMGRRWHGTAKTATVPRNGCDRQ
jgi:hypothetical protein